MKTGDYMIHVSGFLYSDCPDRVLIYQVYLVAGKNFKCDDW